jgi:hypothetical protein
MKEHPILFSSPMVRAILAGKKTMTRRVIISPGHAAGVTMEIDKKSLIKKLFFWRNDFGYSFQLVGKKNQKYDIGDILWVRETWCKQFDNTGKKIEYLADWTNKDTKKAEYINPHGKREHYLNPYGFECPRWRPSIFLSRRDSRINLEITGLRIERIQDITEADAAAEGVEPMDRPEGRPWGRGAGIRIPVRTYRGGFFELWDKLNRRRGYGVEANPWVYAITFKVISQ